MPLTHTTQVGSVSQCLYLRSYFSENKPTSRFPWWLADMGFWEGSLSCPIPHLSLSQLSKLQFAPPRSLLNGKGSSSIQLSMLCLTSSTLSLKTSPECVCISHGFCGALVDFTSCTQNCTWLISLPCFTVLTCLHLSLLNKFKLAQDCTGVCFFLSS